MKYLCGPGIKTYKKLTYNKVTNYLKQSIKWFDLSKVDQGESSFNIAREIFAQFKIDKFEDLDDEQFNEERFVIFVSQNGLFAVFVPEHCVETYDHEKGTLKLKHFTELLIDRPLCLTTVEVEIDEDEDSDENDVVYFRHYSSHGLKT